MDRTPTGPSRRPSRQTLKHPAALTEEPETGLEPEIGPDPSLTQAPAPVVQKRYQLTDTGSDFGTPAASLTNSQRGQNSRVSSTGFRTSTQPRTPSRYQDYPNSTNSYQPNSYQPNSNLPNSHPNSSLNTPVDRWSQAESLEPPLPHEMGAPAAYSTNDGYADGPSFHDQSSSTHQYEHGSPPSTSSLAKSVRAFPLMERPENHASDRASATNRSSSSVRRSIAGFFRRSSLSQPSNPAEDQKTPAKPADAAPEADNAKTEDPQHLLDTILEDPGEEPLMQVDEAAAALAGSDNSVLNEDAYIAKRRQGYRENLARTRRLRKTTRASDTISTLRHWWTAVMQWALLTRVFFYWLPLAIILFIPLACGEWTNKNLRVGHTRIFWLFIWLEVAWASLWIGKVLAHYLPEIFGYLISVFVPNYFKYVDAILAVETPVQLVIFTFITFITCTPLLWLNGDATNDAVRPKWQKTVQSVCVAFLVSAIVYFVEQVFLYIISTSFHKERLQLRIDKQKKSVNVLTILLDMAYSYFPRGCDEFEEEDSSLRHAAINRAQKRTSTKNKVLNKVNEVVGAASKNVSDFVEITSKQDTKPTAARTVKTALTTRDSREILACRIWKSLVMEDENALTFEGLIDVFGQNRKEEVLFMFDILDSDGQDGIDLGEMIDSVNRIGRESKQISRSLVDMNGAIRKLHYLLMSIALILVIVVFVGMLAPSSGTTIATLGSTLISLSWLFQASAQEVFQSCVFLFVKHPYDVGDWIETSVPSLGIVRMRCLQLNLTYSVFTQIGVNTRHQVSHSVLNTQFISNITRSPPGQVNIILTVGIPETRPEHLDELADRLDEFVESNPRDFAPGVFVHPLDQTAVDRMSLNVCINIRNNQDDIVLYSIRRTKALEFISRCIHEIPITLPRRDEVANNDPAVPVFQYNIKTMDEAMAYAEQARGKRQNMGMYPPAPEGLDVESDFEANPIDEKGQVKNSATAAANFQRRRRGSFSSRMTGNSRVSRRMSTSSRASNTNGLRSRHTTQKPSGEEMPSLPPLETELREPGALGGA